MSDIDDLNDDLAVEDLFGGSDDFDDDEEGVQRVPLAVVESIALEHSGAMTLDAQSLKLHTSEDEDSGEIYIRAALKNQTGRPIEVDSVEVELRDSEDRLLDMGEVHSHTRFVDTLEIIEDISVGPYLVSHIGTITFKVQYNFEFQSMLASLECEAIDPPKGAYRAAWPFTIKVPEARPGHPAFKVSASGFHGYIYEATCEWLFEVEETTDSRELEREMAVVLRGVGGGIVARENLYLNLPGRGGSVVVKEEFDVNRKQLRSIRRVDVGIKGRCERHERIGTFRVQPKGE